MTTAEFLTLPDREKDALVAEKVMGWRKKIIHGTEYLIPYESKEVTIHEYVDRVTGKSTGVDLVVPAYSSMIAAAWEVVEHMQSRPGKPTTGDFRLSTPGDIWEAEWSDWFEGRGVIFYRSSAETAPLAICIAALKAKGVITN